MPKEKKTPKERKLSDKQTQILEAVKKSIAANGPGTGYTPSQIGQDCGKAAGSPAADWAYPAIKTMVRKGLLIKAGPGRYTLPGGPVDGAAA